MHDLSSLFSDATLAEEFLDRFDELAASEGAAALLSGLESSLPLDVDAARDAVDDIRDGTWHPDNEGLEAIIKRFTRPVLFVSDAGWSPPRDSFPNSADIRDRLEAARERIGPRLRSVGRIDLVGADLEWCGTGWLVRPGIVVTNRHVAAHFAQAEGDGFAFHEDFDGAPVSAWVDWRREFRVGAESLFRVQEVLWMEPRRRGHPDVAVLRIESTGQDDEDPPAPIELVAEADAAELQADRWTAVVGYPAQDSRQNPRDQQRIFDGVYDVKRLAPGKVTDPGASGRLSHDATTLGGNSGSAVLDLETGRAVALHYGGSTRSKTNYGVPGPLVHEVLTRVLGG